MNPIITGAMEKKPTLRNQETVAVETKGYLKSDYVILFHVATAANGKHEEMLKNIFENIFRQFLETTQNMQKRSLAFYYFRSGYNKGAEDDFLVANTMVQKAAEVLQRNENVEVLFVGSQKEIQDLGPHYTKASATLAPEIQKRFRQIEGDLKEHQATAIVLGVGADYTTAELNAYTAEALDLALRNKKEIDEAKDKLAAGARNAMKSALGAKKAAEDAKKAAEATLKKMQDLLPKGLLLSNIKAGNVAQITQVLATFQPHLAKIGEAENAVSEAVDVARVPFNIMKEAMDFKVKGLSAENSKVLAEAEALSKDTCKIAEDVQKLVDEAGRLLHAIAQRKAELEALEANLSKTKLYTHSDKAGTIHDNDL